MPEEISCRLQTCLVAIPDVAERRYNNLRLISYGSSLIAAQTLRRAIEMFQCDQGVHAKVSDFPGTITYGANLEEARRLLASALGDMVETNPLQGEPLPQPDPAYIDPAADLEEPMHSRVRGR